MKSGGRRILPAVAWLLPLIPVWWYYRDSWSLMRYPFGAAAFFGIYGICGLLTSLVLSSRIRWIDRIYGNDNVVRFHSLMAVISIALIVIHRQLKLWDGPVRTPQTTVGSISFTIIAVAGGISVLFMSKNLIHRIPLLDKFRIWITSGALADYSRLKILHNLLPLATWGAAVHVLMASTTQSDPVRLALMAGYAGITLFLFVHFKFLRPLRRSKHQLVVSGVSKPGKDVTELRFSGDLPNFKPGQFAYWRLDSRGVGREEHPFNICLYHREGEIGFSAKALGNYTAALEKVRPGDTATFDGPYGKFTLPEDSRTPVLMIAGGIGITPFRSMVSHMAETRSLRPTTLIWAVKRRSDLVYAGEFLTFMKRIPDFRYKPVIEVQEIVNLDVTLADYESGLITPGLIKGLCPNLSGSGTVVYICGPDGMRRSIAGILKEMGVMSHRIVYQRF